MDVIQPSFFDMPSEIFNQDEFSKTKKGFVFGPLGSYPESLSWGLAKTYKAVSIDEKEILHFDDSEIKKNSPFASDLVKDFLKKTHVSKINVYKSSVGEAADFLWKFIKFYLKRPQKIIFSGSYLSLAIHEHMNDDEKLLDYMYGFMELSQNRCMKLFLKNNPDQMKNASSISRLMYDQWQTQLLVYTRIAYSNPTSTGYVDVSEIDKNLKLNRIMESYNPLNIYTLEDFTTLDDLMEGFE